MPSRIYSLSIFLGMICLMSVLATTGCAQGGVGINRTVTRPEVVIPFMKTPPKIDGVISEGEYPTLHIARLVAGGNLALQPRLAEFWLGSDGKLLYLAMRTAVNPTYGINIRSYPQKGKRDAGALFGGIFGMVHEDMLDFWIDNNPGGKQGKWYRVAVNPTGAIYDVVYDHSYNIPVTGWRVTMQQAHSLVNGIWTAEFAIDPHSFGISDLHKPFTIRINRFFTLPDDYSHWENCSYVADFPGMGVNIPQSMPRIVFRDTAPIVKEVGVQDTGGIHLALDVTNPTTAPLAVKVALGYTPDKAPLTYENAEVTLQPAETRRFALQRPFASPENYTASGEECVTSPDGAVNYFMRDFKWETHPKGALWDDIKPKPLDPVAHYEIEFHPTPKVLRWRADLNGNPRKAEIAQLRLRVVDTASKAIVTEQQVKTPANFDCTGLIKLSTLKPGRYEAQLFLDANTPAGAPGKAMVFNYATDFPWLNNTIGISDQVIPPYTPMTVNGTGTKRENGKIVVGTILRRHTMSETGLWEQVTALEKPLLAAPMRFEVTQHGKLQPVHGNLRLTEAKAARVVSEATWTAGALRGRTISDFDYDGCMKVTLQLTQQPGTTIESMDLVIPVNNAIAPLFHENGDGLRYNEAGYLPQGEGVVWRSDQASKSAYVGSFIPYLWVGGEERGLCWFANNDKDWVVDCADTAAPALTLERRGNTLNLRVRLIQQPTTLMREHTIVFGLQATPSRPQPELPANWRTWGYGGSKTFNWGFAGMSTYYGCPFYSLVPLNGDYEIIRKIAQSKHESKRDDAFFTAYIDAHPEWRGEVNNASNPGKYNAVIPYTNIRGDEKHNRDWIVYQDEWKVNSFPAWDMFEGWGWERKADDTGAATSHSPEGIDFVVILPKSRRDYLLYQYKQFFENGFDGIYWDNTYIYANNNPVSGDAYTRNDGQVQPSGDIWEMRDLFKRTAVLQYQMGKPNASMIHSTNSYLIPLASWVGYNLDWEWKYGPDDFQNRVARDYVRAATMGRQAGTIPAILDGVEVDSETERSRVQRTRTAVLAVHELTSWLGDLPTTQYFWTLGYGTKACRVYNYWENNPVAKFTGVDDEFLLLENNALGKVAILVADFGEGGAGTVKLDIKRLGLPADFVAVNQEHPEMKLTAHDGAFSFTINKHDYQIFVIEKKK